MTATSAPLTERPAWKALEAHYQQIRQVHLKQLFADDPQRGRNISLPKPGDSTWITRKIGSPGKPSSCCCNSPGTAVCGPVRRHVPGEKINLTEKRAVLHVAFRAPRGVSIQVDGQDVVPEVHAVLDKMSDFANRVRRGQWQGQTGKRIKNVINIGIGGSYLGPEMAYLALRPFSERALTCRFVSNVDGANFWEATHDLDPGETLFVISSKTFTTLETMTNARPPDNG